MTEKQQSIFKWAGRILILLAGLGGILAAAKQLPGQIQEYAALTAALLGFASRWCEQQLPATKAKLPVGPVLLLLGAGLIVSPGCPSAYTPAIKTTAGVMQATKSTSSALGITSAEEHELCLKQGAKTAQYNTCIAATHKRLVSYRDNIRPAVRSAVAAAYAAIRIAKESGKKDLDYMAILKPGACALILGLREWGHKLPNQGGGIVPLLETFKPLACQAPKNALGVITALLPVAVDLVKWIIGIVGANSDDVEKSIYVWITGSPKDEVDTVIGVIDSSLMVVGP